MAMEMVECEHELGRVESMAENTGKHVNKSMAETQEKHFNEDSMAETQKSI